MDNENCDGFYCPLPVRHALFANEERLSVVCSGYKLEFEALLPRSVAKCPGLLGYVAIMMLIALGGQSWVTITSLHRPVTLQNTRTLLSVCAVRILW
jgi:hypothetical protein